eukprot:6208433-Pleurochrysis_carterae.AAC.9
MGLHFLVTLKHSQIRLAANSWSAGRAAMPQRRRATVASKVAKSPRWAEGRNRFRCAGCCLAS